MSLGTPMMTGRTVPDTGGTGGIGSSWLPSDAMPRTPTSSPRTE